MAANFEAQWRIVGLALVALILSACQSSTIIQTDLSKQLLPTKKHVLVTFAQSRGDNWVPGGSARSYHAGQPWSVPLTIRKKISRLERDYGIQQVVAWPIETLSVHCAVFAVDQNAEIDAVLNRLRQEPDVAGAQVVNEFSLMGNATDLANKDSAKKVQSGDDSQSYNDPEFKLQYGDYVDDVRQLHSITRGKSAKVGLIDTRVDLNHPDLQSQDIVQYLFVDDDLVPANHGTAMAGIIAAAADNHIGLVGLAPEAKLFTYAACRADISNHRAQCNSINLLRAIEQAIRDDVRVLNLSLAGPYDPLIAQLLAVAHQRKMIVVAAVNREAPDLNFPASLPTVIGVDELDKGKRGEGNTNSEFFADWIMRGEKLSTRAGGGYQFFYGSSVAAASVSSVAALLQASGAAQGLQANLEGLIREPCFRSQQHNNNQILQYIQSANHCDMTSAIGFQTASDNGENIR